MVHSTNEQGRPRGDGYADPMGSEQTKGSPKENLEQIKEGGCRVQEGKQSPTCSSEGLSTCSEYELTLAWMWDTQDVTCPPHRR